MQYLLDTHTFICINKLPKVVVKNIAHYLRRASNTVLSNFVCGVVPYS